MTASLYDSPAWRGVFYDPDLAPLFSDTAELRANLLVMGTLALTQAKAGLIPEVSAKAIQRAAMEVQIDPAALATVTAETGDPIQAIVAQFKAEMQAPEHAKWVHYDSKPALTAATGLSLRLRQSFKILAGRDPSIQFPSFAGYHTNSAICEGLATGLGLSDGHQSDPIEDIRILAGWIKQHAERTSPEDPVRRAIKHQIRHHDATIQSASAQTAHLINVMTLPQMVLGLGKLLT